MCSLTQNAVYLQFESVGSLEGVVYESDGTTPIVDVPVQLWQVSETTGEAIGVVSSVNTADDGSYRFSSGSCPQLYDPFE